MKTNLPLTYGIILNNLKDKIREARVKAALTVNKELLILYWEIGNLIAQQEKSEGWGSKIVERLAKDLNSEFSDMHGLSARNLRYMRDFRKTYPEFLKLQQPVAKNKTIDNQQVAILQQVVAKLPWSHNVILLEKIKNVQERIFYAQKTIDNGWSRNILITQIESGLFKRQGKAITNFPQTLPAPQSDLAKETIKNPYILDFLNLSEDVQERELERGIIAHLKKFLLELGKGFSYVGNQYNLRVESDDYFLDLLFFNYKLNCFVVFELKVGEFKSEYIGKLNQYINTVDAQIKEQTHQPTIGILLCKTPNKTVVEYSLRGLITPLGVSNYQLSKALPENLKSDLPTVQELERELEKEVQEFQKPVEKKLERLKELISGLKKPQVKEVRNPKTSERVFTKVVLSLRDAIKKVLPKIAKDFKKTKVMIWTDNQGHRTDKETYAFLKKYKEFNQFRIEIRLDGFKPVGTEAFYVSREIFIVTESYFYSVGLGRIQQDQIIQKKLYHELLDKKELEDVVDACIEKIADDITSNIERIQKVNK